MAAIDLPEMMSQLLGNQDWHSGADKLLNNNSWRENKKSRDSLCSGLVGVFTLHLVIVLP